MLRIVVNVHVDFINDWPIVDRKTSSQQTNLGSSLMEVKEKEKFVT